VQPKFPLHVKFLEDGDEWTLESVDELTSSLEWFDSDDPDERATVRDAQGRPVRVKVAALKLQLLELI
jgi:hypothetical protein